MSVSRQSPDCTGTDNKNQGNQTLHTPETQQANRETQQAMETLKVKKITVHISALISKLYTPINEVCQR